MAEGLLVRAALGAVVAQAYTDLYNVAKDAVSQVVWCNKHCKALQQDLSTHLPIFQELCLRLQMPAREWEQRFLESFKEKLEKGTALVQSCLLLSGLHPIRRFRYSRAILKLRQEILQHLQNLPAFNTLQLQQLQDLTDFNTLQINAGLQDVREQQDKDRDELVGELKSVNKSLVDWLRQGAAARDGVSSHADEDEERLLGKRHQLDELIQEDQFLVGLDSRIDEVKSILLSEGEEEKKMVMIVGGMGGIGKTTLALAICKDPQVRGFFEDRIHFFTVSQSPDMKGLLSSIWEQVIGQKPPLFQNKEDAYRQLKGKLLSMPSQRRLLVLDDVWSKASLEKLSFEVKGVKTMITTRQAPTLETRHSHTYPLGLLSKENAHSLFCYWAFDGQDTIPPWVEEPLVVKEVISECNCLPLALKVIGASLSSAGQFPVAWRNARDKLREAKPLGDYHKDALQGRLQTSIDALEPILRECFLDLGAYPEDSLCSADTLLDVWVYVRGMEWIDAVSALVDLSSQCLLDFGKSVTSADVGRALESGGSTTGLVFSQHAVLRDLALHLSGKNHPPSQRTRLLMPQKQKNIPKDWQYWEAPLAARIISIHTGAMEEQDWPATLAFPYAEALFLNIAEELPSVYTLPPFIQSMGKLKVMSISSLAGFGFATGSLGALSQLQSIQLVNVSLHVLNDVNIAMPKLEKLWLRTPGAMDTDIAIKALLDIVLQALQVLKMEFIIFLKELPQNLGQLRALKEVSLRGCSKLRNLPRSFANLTNLQTLDLCYCRSLSHLPRTFGQLVALQKLDMTGCSGLRDLPKNFGLLRSLEILTLDGCYLVKQLPQNFGLLNNLKQLILRNCLSLKHLPDSFGQLRCLKKLDLLDCVSLEKLPDSFGELCCLEHLCLESCVNLTQLPERFGELCCLQVLCLKRCYSLITQLPESFGQLSRLRRLEA